MSGNQEQSGAGENPEARVKAAFVRLGIDLDDDNGMDTDTYVAALNGVADRMEALAAEHVATARQLAERDGQLQEAQAKNAGLQRQVAAQKGQATKARSEHERVSEQLAVALERAPGSMVPRKLPDNPPSIDKGESADLLDLVGEARTVEVVAFFEGLEALGVPPLTIGADVPVPLRVGFPGVVLGVERWEVHGPAKVDSWALYLDGELAAFRRRDSGQLTIGAGQIYNLAPDVLF